MASELAQIRRLASRLNATRDELRLRMASARNNGATLAEIGQAAGMTPQRVHQIVGKKP